MAPSSVAAPNVFSRVLDRATGLRVSVPPRPPGSEWLYQHACRAHATLPGRGRNPNPLLRRRGRPNGRPRWRPAASARSRCAAVSATPRPDSPLPPSGDPTVTRIFAALVACFGGLGLSSVGSLLFGHGRGAGTRGSLHAWAATRAARRRPADHRHRRRPHRSAAHVADRRHQVRRLRLPHVRAEEERQHDERKPVYWGYAAQPFTIDSQSRSYSIAGTGLHAERRRR